MHKPTSHNCDARGRVDELVRFSFSDLTVRPCPRVVYDTYFRAIDENDVSSKPDPRSPFSRDNRSRVMILEAD